MMMVMMMMIKGGDDDDDPLQKKNFTMPNGSKKYLNTHIHIDIHIMKLSRTLRHLT